jgi:hypothetical protein
MRQEFAVLGNYTDDQGNPAGGEVHATGLDIAWQDGPLGWPPDPAKINGAFIETVLDAVAERLNFYQSSKFACPENKDALDHIRAAIDAIDARKDRHARQVEGTHTP